MPINLPPGGGGGATGPAGPPGPPGADGESLPIQDWTNGTYGQVRTNYSPGGNIATTSGTSYNIGVVLEPHGIDNVYFSRTMHFGRFCLQILQTGWYSLALELDWEHNTAGRRYLGITLETAGGNGYLLQEDNPVANIPTDGSSQDWYREFCFVAVPPTGGWIGVSAMQTSGSTLNVIYMSVSAFKVT